MSGVSAPDYVVTDCGDSAVRMTIHDPDRELCWDVVHSIAAALSAHADESAITGIIPTYDALLVEFDCATTEHEAIRRSLQALLATTHVSTPQPPQQFDIPVVYGGEFGPDLDDVARHLELSATEVISLHSARPLTMRCFGSPGGAPMLDGPAFPQPVPRRAIPRPHVPAGAVAVAGRQAVISARPAPGGWPVIGRTPLTIVDPTTEPLSDFRPGDTFRFFAIPPECWTRYEAVRHG